LAPLHQPHHLTAIRALKQLHPQLPQVACFDTAFHHTLPLVAQLYALPHSFFEQGIRRYGFHGLSYEYINNLLPTHLGELANGRIIIAHLGNGASMCALHQRHAIATTMGFTPLDGLPMGTRCGAIDPGVLLFLLQQQQMDVAQLQQLLYHQSGLLGLSGISSDMREILSSNTQEAKQAVDYFVHRCCVEIGGLSAALGGLDALIFTGGIGEHADTVRATVSERLAWLGIELDETANKNNQTTLHSQNSRIPVLVLATDEELQIARHTVVTLNN
jgi:acetate kinase